MVPVLAGGGATCNPRFTGAGIPVGASSVRCVFLEMIRLELAGMYRVPRSVFLQSLWPRLRRFGGGACLRPSSMAPWEPGSTRWKGTSCHFGRGGTRRSRRRHGAGPGWPRHGGIADRLGAGLAALGRRGTGATPPRRDAAPPRRATARRSKPTARTPRPSSACTALQNWPATPSAKA